MDATVASGVSRARRADLCEPALHRSHNTKPGGANDARRALNFSSLDCVSHREVSRKDGSKFPGKGGFRSQLAMFELGTGIPIFGQLSHFCDNGFGCNLLIDRALELRHAGHPRAIL